MPYFLMRNEDPIADEIKEISGIIELDDDFDLKEEYLKLLPAATNMSRRSPACGTKEELSSCDVRTYLFPMSLCVLTAAALVNNLQKWLPGFLVFLTAIAGGDGCS